MMDVSLWDDAEWSQLLGPVTFAGCQFDRPRFWSGVTDASDERTMGVAVVAPEGPPGSPGELWLPHRSSRWRPSSCICSRPAPLETPAASSICPASWWSRLCGGSDWRPIYPFLSADGSCFVATVILS